jgi:hypothetical protein
LELYFTFFADVIYGETTAGRQVQCYACGLPKVHPEFDIVGSYGNKIYNHSCEELMSTMIDEVIDERFVRTCPVGVKSCFGATGFYDHDDNDPTNDICKKYFMFKKNICFNLFMIKLHA